MYSRGLQSYGHSIDVLEPKDYEIGQRYAKAKKFRQAWGAWRAVKQKLRANKYDLVEFYGDEFWLVSWQLSKSRNRPLLVAHTNGLELLDRSRSQFYNPRRSRLQRWVSLQTHERFSHLAFAYADAFVSLCELDQQHVLDLMLYPIELTSVVEPGLDEEYLAVPFSPLKEERVAFNGSWLPRKGIKELAAVMSVVLARNPKLHFDVYGTGGARDVVLSTFPAELHARITVHPRISNKELADSLAKAKIFFFPSQYEGFGIALAEAMACGCAVVTTRTGFGWALRDREEAWLCDFDDVMAMENAVQRLLQDDAMRTKVAVGGWHRVRALTWQSNVKKLEAIYRGWLSNPQYENRKIKARYSHANNF
ncbi:MAG: hypothetical protein QOH63_3347 [Acidobacteriota bacterium]|jgi:glycosyltransferase involved in cell wall biosynthesis|nr:hypothetical protein [Acidobacteriota bacterium]